MGTFFKLGPPILLASGAICDCLGHLTEQLSTDADLLISSKNVLTIGCLAEIKPLPILDLRLGPTVNFLNFRWHTGGGTTPDQTKAGPRIGIAAGAHVSIPARSSTFFRVAWLYRYTGGFDVGPIDAGNEQGEVLTTMPESSVAANQATVMLGIGFRI